MILPKETSVIINYCFHNPFVERSTHPTWKPTIKTIYDWSTIAWSCHIRPQLKSLIRVSKYCSDRAKSRGVRCKVHSKLLINYVLNNHKTWCLIKINAQLYSCRSTKHFPSPLATSLGSLLLRINCSLNRPDDKPSDLEHLGNRIDALGLFTSGIVFLSCYRTYNIK